MTWLDEHSAAVQAVCTVALLLITAAYAWLTRSIAKASERSLSMTAQATRVESLLRLTEFLQAPEVRAARTHVREVLRNSRDHRAWSTQDRRSADTVCATYDPVGVLISEGLVEREPFLTVWGPSIRDCFSILEHYIKFRQSTSGSVYWSNFEWMAGEVPAEPPRSDQVD